MRQTKEEILRAVAMAALEINIRFAPKKYYGPPAPDKPPRKPYYNSSFAPHPDARYWEWRNGR